ncbi:dipeptide ABC transporter ATP-binding protein [Cryptosporangium sp. NPDC051539]|uniref:dipeptide ABC transporter ATP-binding protein n=1 Tax=Cryptosporangium sp. NPDC051539 TaxID=3363962 RepID=UPI0037B992DE
MTTKDVLEIRDLTVDYVSRGGRTPTVSDFALTVTSGRIYGVVGESGSGKSTSVLAGIGWTSPALHRVAGSSHVLGEDVCALSDRELRRVWGRRVGYVPQEVGGALHPSFTIRHQFRESLRLNRGLGKGEADARARALLEVAGLPRPAEALTKYPHQFSGGQLQRIAIALALAPGPDVIVLDEPTTGLDVTTQRLVVDVLRRLASQEHVAVVFVSHDIALLAEYADELVVMYAGEIVENGDVSTVLQRPRHPYTRALLDAVPTPHRKQLPVNIPGLPPGRVVLDACAFAPRCAHAQPRCGEEKPKFAQRVRCHRAGELNLAPATSNEVRRRRELGSAVLTARDVVVEYARGVRAVDEVSITLRTGNVTALVGESGSGKSSLGGVIAGLRKPDGGKLEFRGNVLPRDPRRRSRSDRRDIQLIFQSTAGSLNPRRTVGDHLSHVAGCFDRPASAVPGILEAVRLPDALLRRYPAELSGGQKQRVAIAAAFLADPAVVVADEITSGQDVSVQAAILETLARMQDAHRTAVLFISHDLGVVRSIADEVYVMRHGSVVEFGPTDDVFDDPRHEYTLQLLAAAPAGPTRLLDTRP